MRTEVWLSTTFAMSPNRFSMSSAFAESRFKCLVDMRQRIASKVQQTNILLCLLLPANGIPALNP